MLFCYFLKRRVTLSRVFPSKSFSLKILNSLIRLYRQEILILIILRKVPKDFLNGLVLKRLLLSVTLLYLTLNLMLRDLRQLFQLPLRIRIFNLLEEACSFLDQINFVLYNLPKFFLRTSLS